MRLSFIFSVQASDEKAAHWFLKAAGNGHLNAHLEMARAYSLGIGVQKSDEEALVWLTFAAERNDATSQYAVGKYYELGLGVNADLANCFEVVC